MLVLLIIIASFAQMLVSLTFDGYMYEEGDAAGAGTSASGLSYLKAYTIMLGDIDMEFLQAHSGIVVLFVLYTFGVTIVLLNVLIAIVGESYASAMYSSNLMLGKARIIFVSELMGLKSRYQLKGGAAERSSKRNAMISLVLSALWIKTIIGTVLIKLECMKMPPKTIICGLSTIEIEAVAIFFTLVSIITSHKAAMIQSLAISSLKPQQEKSKITLFSILAEKLQRDIGRNIDSLMDNDGSKATSDSETNAAPHGKIAVDWRMQRTLNTTRKELKAEVRKSQEIMRLIIHEAEDKTHASIAICEHHLSSSLADVASSMQENIDSAIAASEERIIQALSSRLDRRVLNEGRPVESARKNAQVQEEPMESDAPN